MGFARPPHNISTQNPTLTKGLVVTDKEKRVANFHKETIASLVELLAAAGLKHPEQLNRPHIHRRISATEVRRYDEIFPYLPPGELSLFACCKKSLKVSLIVGTILSAVNQGGVILDHTFSTQDLIRIILNYLVPLAVATYSRLALLKELK